MGAKVYNCPGPITTEFGIFCRVHRWEIPDCVKCYEERDEYIAKEADRAYDRLVDRQAEHD